MFDNKGNYKNKEKLFEKLFSRKANKMCGAQFRYINRVILKTKLRLIRINNWYLIKITVQKPST